MSAVPLGLPTIGAPSPVLPAGLPDELPVGHLSVSQVVGWTGCGWRYKLERVDKVVQAPAWALIGGKALHSAYEDIVTLGLDAADAEQSFAHFLRVECEVALESEPDETKWRASGRSTKDFPNKEDGQWWALKGAQMCAGFAAVQGSAFLPGKVASMMPAFLDGETSREYRVRVPDAVPQPLIEVQFDVQIGENMVKGFIDAVIIGDRGDLVPRDYKSGAIPKTAFQLATYGEAMRQLYGKRPTRGQYLMTRALLPGAKGMVIIEPDDYDVYDYDVLCRTYDSMGKAKVAEIFLPQPSNMCVACGVRDSCVFKPSEKSMSHPTPAAA